MKKTVVILCVLAMGMPAMARPNYSYTMPSEERISMNTQEFNVTVEPEYISSNQTYSVDISKNTEVEPESIAPRTKTPRRKTPTNKETITQVGSIVYYDSGKKTTMSTGAAAAIGTAALLCLLDPYIVTLNGKEYMMIQDTNNIFEKSDILGIDDNVKTIFRAISALDKDFDGFITSKELQDENIRFVRKKNNIIYFSDKSKDFDINLVKYIPTKSFRKTYYKQTMVYTKNRIKTFPNYGTFGTFDIFTYVNKNKKTSVQNFGKVDFVKEETIQKWLSGNK